MGKLKELIAQLESADKRINDLAAKRDAEKDEAKKAGLVALLQDEVNDFEALEAKVAEAEQAEMRSKKIASRKDEAQKPEGKAENITEPVKADVADSRHNAEIGIRTEDAISYGYLTSPMGAKNFLGMVAAKRGERAIDACRVVGERGLRAPSWIRDFVLPQSTAEQAVRDAFPKLAGKDALEAFIEGKGTDDVLIRNASGTASGGGSLVGPTMITELYKRPQIQDDIASRCWVKRGIGKSALFPKLTQSSTEPYGVTIRWGNAGASGGEGNGLSESNPVFTQVEVATERLGLFSYISDKAIRAEQVGLEAELAWMYRGAANQALAKAILHGNTCGNPVGVNVNASIANGVVVVARETLGKISYTDCVNLQHSVENGVMDDGLFILSSGVNGALKYVAGLDDSSGRPVFAPENTWGFARPATIAGAPYVKVSPAVSPRVGYRGDLMYAHLMSYGLVVDVDQMAIERSDDFAFTSGLITYRMQMYVGGTPLGYQCFAVLGDVSGASSSSSSSST